MKSRSPSPESWNAYHLAGLAALITILVFLPTVTYDFVNWDDDQYVYGNPVVLNGLTLQGIWRAWTCVYVCNWAPLTIMSYQCDSSLYGSAPWGFHLTNILAHGIATGLMIVVLVRMTECVWRSVAAAMFFGLHPLRAESVAWISERKDVLSVLLLMLTLLAYDRFCRRPTAARYMMVFALMCLGLLAKASLVSLPLLLLILDIWPLARLDCPAVRKMWPNKATLSHYPLRPSPSIVLEKLPLALLSVVFIVLTLITQREAIHADDTMPFFSVRLPNAARALTWYACKTFVPTGLCAYHPFPGNASLGAFLIGLCFAGGLVFFGRHTLRRSPAVISGLAWFVVALVPFLGFVQAGSQGTADRYSYIPHFGFMIAVVWGVADILHTQRFFRIASTLVVFTISAGLVWLTERQISTWQDSDALWAQALAVHPTNYLARFQRGQLLEGKGNVSAAVDEYRLALKVMDNVRIHRSLAQALLQDGRPAEALPHFAKVIMIDPDDVEMLKHTVIALAAVGKVDDAVAVCRRYVTVQPDSVDGFSRLGQLLLKTGDLPAAIAALRRAADLDPSYPHIFELLEEARYRSGKASEPQSIPTLAPDNDLISPAADHKAAPSR